LEGLESKERDQEVDMAKEYDVIVVGAGPGGTCCAALLAKKGLKVLLLEKNAKVGGKTMDQVSKGAHGERWATAGLPAVRGPFIDAFKALGIESKLDIVVKPMTIKYRRSGGRWTSTVFDLENVGGQDPSESLGSMGLNKKEREIALQLMAEFYSMTPEQIDKLDDISVTDWCAQRPEIPYAVYRYLAYSLQVNQEGLPEHMPMSVVDNYVHQTSQPLGYPRGGYGRLTEDMAETFKKYGGELITRARVERILVEKGWATGVLTKGGFFRAPVVVSDAGIQPTVIKLVGEEHFDHSYVAYVKGLLPSLGFSGVRYILREPVLPYALYQIWSDDSWWDLKEYLRIKAGGAPKDVTVSLVVPTNYDPNMGPPGKQVLVFGTNCSPDTRDDAVLKAVTKRAEEEVTELFPEIVPAIEYKGYAGPRDVAALSRDEVLPGSGGEYALAMTIGQTGKYKPSARSPIPGLFYVGFDVGTTKRWHGSNCAVDSGINVAAMVYQYYLGRQFVGW
jgi:phytoene dehydrogenase-like protein